MEKLFTIILQNRKILRAILAKLPINMLTKIPDGYRNNIWWNMAHTVAIHQSLLYRLSGLPTLAEEDWIDNYKKGTVPNAEPGAEEVNMLLELIISSAKKAEEDYNNGLFKEYKEYTTSNKVTLSTVEDAISFDAFHEGLHLGVILSQLKSLGISIS